ncbi:MAG: serine/threonine protein kinase [Candidatus Krumholzibacteria bacterium]|nr:serine/threonine protein kinase [Candidatus Krumholzibacteria bacterium]
MAEATDPLKRRLDEALGEAYSVDHEIGRGGMGVVYHARDQRLKRDVAIKVLPPELAFREDIRTRFLREAETAARLSHPHIVPIHAVGEGPDGLVYFVMAFVEGESVAERLRRRGRLPGEEVRRVLTETADALGAAHALGIIHRDVKPDNILLEGSRGRVVVTDFGIAKALSSTTGPNTALTATGVAIGTPHFMSPEQAAGDREVDGRSDLYSLGVVAYQMLTGELPFTAPTVPGILLKHITELAAPIDVKRPDCPPDLGGAVMRCLEKNPDDRWPTADALRRALESRSTPAYRARAGARPPVGRAGGSAMSRSADLGRLPVRRGPPGRALEATKLGGEPAIVRQMRSKFVSWASVCGGLMFVDLASGWGGWSFMVAAVWGAFGIIPQYVRLWNAGYSWRDVLHRPAAPDAVEARLPPARGRAAALGPASGDEFGRQADVINQARLDRKAILGIVERLPKAERALLPDVAATVDGLLARAENLARMLHAMGGVEGDAVPHIEERIAALRNEAAGAERDRQLSLLERQQQTLADLLARRRRVAEQLESCILAMQNVRFDLLRLRSAGVDAVLGDLTQATQQARALSRDVDHVIAAAGEVREVLGKPYH